MFRLTTARPNLSQDQSGQATIEAVLLGFISFMLVMGLVYRFNAGFRDYIDNYFGNYVVCLLETGELPALGSGRQSVCSEALATFELGEEGPGLDGSPSGSGGGSSSASGQSDSPARSADGGSSGSGSGNISYVNSSRGGGSSIGSDGASSKTEGSSERGSSGDGGAPSGGSGYTIVEVRGSSRSTPRSITLKKVESGVDVQQEGEGAKKGTLTSKQNENALAATKLTFNPDSLKRTPAAEEASVEWSFGDYLRYLIILAIIIAIIILVGGQALQISKSRDL